ncbi:hypothetical protein ACLMJK_002935 [Lecanora helva]
MDPTTIVPTFNALPRNKLSPSGSVPNHWHISLRTVPLQPPGELLFIISPPSRYIHVEGPLPPSFATSSPEMRSSMIGILLLQAFNGGLGAGHEGGGVGRPWSWVCQDAEMAGGVGETLRLMGVTEPGDMGIAESEENEIADESWGSFMDKLRGQVGEG